VKTRKNRSFDSFQPFSLLLSSPHLLRQFHAEKRTRRKKTHPASTHDLLQRTGAYIRMTLSTRGPKPFWPLAKEGFTCVGKMDHVLLRLRRRPRRRSKNRQI